MTTAPTTLLVLLGGTKPASHAPAAIMGQAIGQVGRDSQDGTVESGTRNKDWEEEEWEEEMEE